MNPKKLKQLKKQHRKAILQPRQSTYIQQLTQYGELFQDFPRIKYLINLILVNDRLMQDQLLPQPVVKMLLPDDIQDEIFTYLNQHYPSGDPTGDRLWEEYSEALPKLDRLLRNYRDYLEATYGMWSFTNTKFISALSKYLQGAPVLEIMAGNGYISKGLRDLNHQQTIITTDDQSWTKENETGKHPVVKVQNYSAIDAIKTFYDQVDYVIMAWAPDKGDADWQVLQLIRQTYPELKLLVIGEYQGATNSQQFWQTAQLSQPDAFQPLNQALQSFDLIDEQIYLAQ
ncbi:SAM-dependent methyltransferase [Limosilactobacillus gastricus]|uniref:SAM-dependent methyltransferase n=1 Tax=Limosilactobacillus gastricus TaxID=227942 RepID=UPI0026F32627|nr:SAM-dependent methyltransferase [Limosilactobacillus gastricus]